MNVYAIVSKHQCCLNWERSFYVLPYEIDGVQQLPNEDITKNYNHDDYTDWDEVYSGDWTYKLYTVDEAIEEIKREEYWFAEYKACRLADMEGLELDSFDSEYPVTISFAGFFNYIEDVADTYSLEGCFVEIIRMEGRYE